MTIAWTAKIILMVAVLFTCYYIPCVWGKDK